MPSQLFLLSLSTSALKIPAAHSLRSWVVLQQTLKCGINYSVASLLARFLSRGRVQASVSNSNCRQSAANFEWQASYVVRNLKEWSLRLQSCPASSAVVESVRRLLFARKYHNSIYLDLHNTAEANFYSPMALSFCSLPLFFALCAQEIRNIPACV